MIKREVKKNEEFQQKSPAEALERVVEINRCAKVVKGGRRFSFSALVVVGDRNGQVGYALGKARENADAIRKATETARRNMIRVTMKDRTIPHEVMGHCGASRVMLKPASKGTGIIAGGPVRAIMEACGVHDILTKAIGTNTPHNVLRATMDGLASLRSADSVSAMRGKALSTPRK